MNKYNLENIAKISKKLKLKGKKIGLCHGVFDIIHAGHISHFEEAKKKCDFLFVTITEDNHVNKGPNRPINNHYLRAKILDSLKQVDYVGINFNLDATNSINKIKPNFYFKGNDYKGKKDHTNRLNREIQTVKKNDGKIIFTTSPLKSSTQIINKSFPYIFESKLTSFLKNLDKDRLLNKCILELDKIKDKKVLIIGDAIIDQYDKVKALNKPIKESILATKFLSSEVFLGGVFAAAENLSQFCNSVSVCTVVGNDKDLKKKLTRFKNKVNSFIALEKNKVTTRKRRFVEDGYNRKLNEVYFMSDDFLSKNNKANIKNYLKKNLKKFDSVILIDYGHGFIDSEIFNILKNKSKFLSVNCQTNSANLGFNLITKYKGADYICIDEPELRLAASNNSDDLKKILSKKLLNKIECKNITITRGREGSFSFHNGKILEVPALVSEKVVDTIGAGDVFLVISSLLYSNGSDQVVTNIIGNTAGALKVDILGHSKSISISNFYSVLNHILK